MKALFILILVVASVNVSEATVRTVCNMPYSPGQFTTFAAALTASAPNDTIYVHGSAINYGPITVNKNGIVVIGTGHNPAKIVPLVATFTVITLNATGCQFIGLTFDNLAAGFPSSATTVKRCKIVSPGFSNGVNIPFGQGDNWLIEGNVFNSPTATNNIVFGSGTSSNTIIRNNVFSGQIINNSSVTTDFTFLITNNIFLGLLSGNTFPGIWDAVITNNIFYRSSPGAGPANGVTTMSNNISFQCLNNNFGAPGANNLTGVNPQFTTFPLAGALFDYAHDYHLAVGSPGIGTGTDGTDRGLYGGFGTKFNMTGEPNISEITDFLITSPATIAPGGTLTISVTSKRVN
jgi:hypothetical protein